MSALILPDQLLIHCEIRIQTALVRKQQAMGGVLVDLQMASWNHGGLSPARKGAAMLFKMLAAPNLKKSRRSGFISRIIYE